MLAASAFVGTALLSLSLRLNRQPPSSSDNITSGNSGSTRDATATQHRQSPALTPTPSFASPLKHNKQKRTTESKSKKSNADIKKEAPVASNSKDKATNSSSKEARVEATSDANGHHFGNFHEYYTFHKCEDRCASLSERFFIDIWEHCGKPEVLHLLDVGCNEGDLTNEVLKEAQKQLPNVTIKAVGVDLDSELIERATIKYKDDSSLLFATVDVMEADSLSSFMSSQKIESFALVSCFSITMWIHMNHGDDGLRKFLHLMGSVSNCSVLLEPQLWKSYRKANERCRRRGIPELPYFSTLKIKDIKQACIDTFTKSFRMILQQNNETPGWNRPLILLSFKPLTHVKL
jgi:SAM-dependent methyltransferase